MTSSQYSKGAIISISSCECAAFWTDLVVPVLLQEVSGHVAGQDVPQHVLVVFSQILHLVDLLFGLDAPQEVQPGRVLQLKMEKNTRS